MNTRPTQNKRLVLEAFDTLVEHSDVIQDETTRREESKSKAPMFVPRYPNRTSRA